MQKVCQVEELSNSQRKLLDAFLQYSNQDCSASNRKVILNLPKESLSKLLLFKTERLKIFAVAPSYWSWSKFPLIHR